MLSRSERLSSRQFDAAFGASRSSRDALISLRVHWRAPGSAENLRAAFVVPKKMGKATWRNRVRRRMREAFHVQRAELQKMTAVAGACDCIFLAQAGANEAEFAVLQVSIRSLLERAVGERKRNRSAPPRSFSSRPRRKEQGGAAST
jgi:ribonuclease P protein component